MERDNAAKAHFDVWVGGAKVDPETQFPLFDNETGVIFTAEPTNG